uniref:Uncharacterized protein n=1 Tax=Eutreptiella gymnastica TaxID=73025 RepID=A0A7S1I719_9EUGL|mmetsp:Transcript_135162/g.234367  ORF Transcript_135162/g.234367 Transcript_135162/m.234367 type:complete len:215 (+) Transcript_135162:472-1116(+)
MQEIPAQTQEECKSKWDQAYKLCDKLQWPDDPLNEHTQPKPAVLRQCARIIDTIFFEGTLFKKRILSFTKNRGGIQLSIVFEEEPGEGYKKPEERVAVTYKEEEGEEGEEEQTEIVLYRSQLQTKWEEKGQGYFCIYDFTPRSTQHAVLHCVARQLLYAIDADYSKRDWGDARRVQTHILGSGAVLKSSHRSEETWNWRVRLLRWAVQGPRMRL